MSELTVSTTICRLVAERPRPFFSRRLSFTLGGHQTRCWAILRAGGGNPAVGSRRVLSEAAIKVKLMAAYQDS